MCEGVRQRGVRGCNVRRARSLSVTSIEEGREGGRQRCRRRERDGQRERQTDRDRDKDKGKDAEVPSGRTRESDRVRALRGSGRCGHGRQGWGRDDGADAERDAHLHPRDSAWEEEEVRGKQSETRYENPRYCVLICTQLLCNYSAGGGGRREGGGLVSVCAESVELPGLGCPV